jgi:hypothetical protein
MDPLSWDEPHWEKGEIDDVKRIFEGILGRSCCGSESSPSCVLHTNQLDVLFWPNAYAQMEGRMMMSERMEEERQLVFSLGMEEWKNGGRGIIGYILSGRNVLPK